MCFCWLDLGFDVAGCLDLFVVVGFVVATADWAVPSVDEGEDVVFDEGLLMPNARLAGGPTGTILEPNSTPMVTSWEFVKRPSQSRTVSWS